MTRKAHLLSSYLHEGRWEFGNCAWWMFKTIQTSKSHYGVEIAFYLIHSMEGSIKGMEKI